MTRSARLLVALLVGCLILATLAVPATAASASISLSVDGEPVEAGTTTDVQQDPRLGITVSAEAVIVRLNGDTVRTFEPGTTSFEQATELAIPDGENEVTVITETADGVDSQTVTIIKDDRGPFIRFTSPFETDHHRDVIPDNATVEAGQVVVAGTLHDASGVRRISIHRQYIFYHANVQHVASERWEVTDPGNRFRQPILLGNGTNAVSIRVTDRVGQARDYTIDLTVNDTEPPVLDVQLPNTTGRADLPIGGEVADNSQLDRVTVSVEGSLESKVLYDGLDEEPDAAATKMGIPGTVPLRPGENVVTVTATDLAGNSASVTRTVVYEKTIEPVVSFDRSATSLDAGGPIRVVGTVSDGEITRVSVETVAVDSGEVVDLARVYTEGSVTDEVTIDESLATAEGETRVVVRTTDSEGTERQTGFTVEPSSGEIRWPGEPESPDEEADAETATQTETATPTPTPTPTATATPSEDDGLMGLTSVAEGLPGFTSVTAVAALLVVLGLAARGRRLD